MLTEFTFKSKYDTIRFIGIAMTRIRIASTRARIPEKLNVLLFLLFISYYPFFQRLASSEITVHATNTNITVMKNIISENLMIPCAK